MYYNTPYSSSNTSSIYRVGDFIPQTTRGWDDYAARLARYDILEGFYNNLAYHKIMQYAQQLKVEERLYKHVRGVRNSTKRLAEAYVANVYGGMLDIETGAAGAIPLQSDNPSIVEAVISLWMKSYWGQKKSLYVRNGAMKGDSFIKVVDDVSKQHVRIEPVDPAKVKKIVKEPDGTIIYAELEYYIRDMDTGYNRLYREVITPEKFEIFTREDVTRNGRFIRSEIRPFAAATNGRGEPVSEWDNEYGFVPIVHVQHMDMGLMYGAPAIHGSLHKINELNDIASMLNDGLRRQINMPLVFLNADVNAIDFGADQSTNTTQQDDTPRKDTQTALSLKGENSDVKTLSPTVIIRDGLELIASTEEEIEKDQPILALHRLRNSTNLTAPGVRAGFGDAIADVQEKRGNYDTGLVAAHRMGLWIMDMRNYDKSPGINASTWDDDALNHQIATRPVINDTLSKKEQAEMTIQGLSSNAPKSFYIHIGWGDTEADEMVASAESSRNQFMLGINTPQSGAETAPPDDPEATPEDMFRARQDTGVNETDLLNADNLLAEAVA